MMSFQKNKILQTSCIKPDSPPAWSEKIDRWTQLDDTSFTFCQALHEWHYLENFSRPDFVFLVLENASNAADLDFIQSGAVSPAKFVFTLPNICAAVLFHLLNYRGRTFCLSNGKNSLELATREALDFLKNKKTSWIFSNSIDPLNGHRVVQFLDFTN